VGLVALTVDAGLKVDWRANGTVEPGSTTTSTGAAAGGTSATGAVSGAGRGGAGGLGVVLGMVGLCVMMGGL